MPLYTDMLLTLYIYRLNFVKIQIIYIYILNRLDHFSKYFISELIIKIQNLIIKVKNLLSKYKIKSIKWRPYNPKSQEIVERVHRTVRNGLICIYLENKDKFNLKNSLKKLVFIYNNSTHRTTLYKPVDIFYTNDSNLFEKI